MSRTGDENVRWRCLWSQNALQRDSAIFNLPHHKKYFFLHFYIADHYTLKYTVRWEKTRIRINLLMFSHINFDNTTNSHWGILKEFSSVFQENCLTSICIAVSKASSPPEARSLLWLIMMSSAHLYTAALTNSGRFTSIYSGLKCRPLASSIRNFSTV